MSALQRWDLKGRGTPTGSAMHTQRWRGGRQRSHHSFSQEAVKAPSKPPVLSSSRRRRRFGVLALTHTNNNSHAQEWSFRKARPKATSTLRLAKYTLLALSCHSLKINKSRRLPVIIFEWFSYFILLFAHSVHVMQSRRPLIAGVRLNVSLTPLAAVICPCISETCRGELGNSSRSWGISARCKQAWRQEHNYFVLEVLLAVAQEGDEKYSQFWLQ